MQSSFNHNVVKNDAASCENKFKGTVMQII